LEKWEKGGKKYWENIEKNFTYPRDAVLGACKDFRNRDNDKLFFVRNGHFE
jgi:hypothetical protein